MKPGDYINSFTILELAENGSNGRHKRWKVECDCGRWLVKASTDIKRQQSCGCHQRFCPINQMYKHLMVRHEDYEGKLISVKEFEDVSASNCFYCDIPPCNNSYGWTYSGIDRIDNLLGYVTGNVRPCCQICNRMKSDMNVEEFHKHLARIKDGPHWQLPWKQYP